MNMQTLKENIIAKSFAPLYVFTGDEVAVMNIYIKKIGELTGQIKRPDSVLSAFNQMQSNTLMNKPTCYVIRDDKEYTQKDKVWASLKAGLVQGENIVILIYPNLNKNTKFYKEHVDCIIEFEKLEPELLAKYIKKEIGLEIKYGLELARICNYDYSRVLLECDKLFHLNNARGYNSIELTFHEAVADKLMFTYSTDVVFELIDSICRRQIQRSFDLFRELVEIDSGPLGVLTLLYSNLKAMLLVQSAGSGDVSDKTGLTVWQIKMAREKSGHYSVGELVNALRLVRGAEKGIKTGTISADMTVEYILVNLL